MTIQATERYEIIAHASKNDHYFSDCPNSAKYGDTPTQYADLDDAIDAAESLASSGDWMRDGVDYTPTYRVYDNQAGKYVS